MNDASDSVIACQTSYDGAEIWPDDGYLGVSIPRASLSPVDQETDVTLTGIDEILALSGIIFFAATLKAIFGFGEALIAMPLLTWFLPIEQAAPTVALMSILTGSSVLIREWKHIHFRNALVMIIPAMISIPLGVWLLRSADHRLVKSFLAVMILGFSLWSLQQRHRAELSDDRWAPFVGFFAGLLGGAYNTAGPPVVIYGTLRHWTPEKFRGQLQSFFSFCTFWVVSTHFSQGMITEQVLWNFLASIPGLLLGLTAGYFISKQIPIHRFREVIYYLLILIGAMLLWNVFS